MSYRRYTTVFDRAASNALIDLATVKEELGIADDDSSKDSILDREITQISAAAARYCNRTFNAEGLVDTYRWGHSGWGESGTESLSLSRYPLAGFLLSPTTADTASGTALPIEDTSAAAAGVIVSGANIPTGTKVADADETMVTLTNAITGDVPSGSIIAFGLEIVVCPNTAGAKVLVPDTDYFIDGAAGLIQRCHGGFLSHRWGGETIAVRYRGGYIDDDMPADVQMAVLRWITMRQTARGRDPMLKRREERGNNIDLNEEYWVDVSATKQSIPEEIAGLLDSYVVPIIG